MRAAGLEIKIKIKIKTLGSFPFHAAYAPTPAVHATVATALNEADSSDHMEADMLVVPPPGLLSRFRKFRTSNNHDHPSVFETTVLNAPV